MTEEFVEKVVVDVCSRRVCCVSSKGDRRILESETFTEFMNVLNFVKTTLDEDEIVYTEILVDEDR
tara:strand:+ start:70 stop:267 length:198 start_codon:yes stop_codon:yes gene_type:complete